jgi:RNA polymerase sigma-70 factor (ECF subfamily)
MTDRRVHLFLETLVTAPEPEPDDFEDIRCLLVEAKAGSASARNELFARFQQYLAYLAQQHQNPRLTAKLGASDIIQQTLFQAAGQFDDFRGTTVEQFRGWLRQILVNEARGLNRRFGAQRRSAGREFSLEPEDSSSSYFSQFVDEMLTPSSEAMARERALAVQTALEKLPAELRQVIRLRNWEKLQFREIGERMNVSTSSAAKLWYKALVELQRIHAEQSENE